MLKQCAKRACYNTLQKHDLLTPLPFEEKRFDCLISVAVTTYLSKRFPPSFDLENFILCTISAKKLIMLIESFFLNAVLVFFIVYTKVALLYFDTMPQY